MENEIVTTAQNRDYNEDFKTEIAQIIKSNLAPAIMRERILDYHEGREVKTVLHS